MAKGGSRYGAGRPGWRRKAESSLRIDLRALIRKRLLEGRWFSWTWTNSHTGEEVGSISMKGNLSQLELSFSADGLPKAQTMTIERTACHFGGSRAWVRCCGCHKRVAVLFFGRGRFTCRTCALVTYSSQCEDSMARAWRRQSRLESKLEENWTRPSGMRQATYKRTIAAIMKCEDQRDMFLAAFLGRLGMLGEI